MLNKKQIAAYKDLLEKYLPICKHILEEKKNKHQRLVIGLDVGSLPQTAKEVIDATVHLKEVEAMLAAIKIITLDGGGQQYKNILKSINAWVQNKAEHNV